MKKNSGKRASSPTTSGTNAENQNTFSRIYDVVKRIPPGMVSTYGTVAMAAGNPRWSRIVGCALHVNPDNSGIPCFRVVNRFGECSGSFAFGGAGAQRELLERDGVSFLADGRVDLKKHLYLFNETE